MSLFGTVGSGRAIPPLPNSDDLEFRAGGRMQRQPGLVNHGDIELIGRDECRVISCGCEMSALGPVYAGQRTLKCAAAQAVWCQKETIASCQGATSPVLLLLGLSRRSSKRAICAIATNGTKKQGISANGRRCMVAVFIEEANPGHR